MSKETWLKKFYPFGHPTTELSALKCLDRDILKWQGVLPSNLRAHGVTFYAGKVKCGSSIILIYAVDTCASCLLSRPSCAKCAITKYSGNHCLSNYNIAVYQGDPKPLLGQLRKARRNLLTELV